MTDPDGDMNRWTRLTDRQRACLDLVLERKTSKEIARILQISKPTVDQRITAARVILGAPDRDKAAITYARLKATYDRIIYDPVELPSQVVLVPSDFSDGDPSAVMVVNDRSSAIVAADRSRGSAPPARVLWRHDHTLFDRVKIMIAILAAMAFTALAGLSIALSLTQLFSD